MAIENRMTTIDWLDDIKYSSVSNVILHKYELEKIMDLKEKNITEDYEEIIVNFSPDKINKIYLKTVDEIIKSSQFNFSEKSNEFFQIIKLIKEFKKENPQPINYDKYWVAFNQKYFFKNLYKTLITIAYLQNQGFNVTKELQVVDVGCGAGVGTIAWNILFGERTSKIILIDKNRYQLDLAKQFTKIIEKNSFEFYNASFPDEFDQLAGIRIFSYFFCEQDYNRFFNNENLSKIIGEGALIIDYPYIINRFQKMLGHKFKFTKWTIKVENIPEILKENKKVQYIYGAYIRF